MQTHYVSKVDLGKRERFERGAGEPDSLLDVFFKELLHVHAEERPGLLQHLSAQSKKKKKERVKTPWFHTFIK